MLAYCRRRWAVSGLPSNLWLGVSVESAAQSGRIKALRRLRQDIGSFTSIICAEPLIGPPQGLSLEGIDWVICGGESGSSARPINADWVRWLRDACAVGGVPLWFKAWGHWRHNPAWPLAQGRTQKDRKQDLLDRHLELCGTEQGGATLDGQLRRYLPGAYLQSHAALSAETTVS